MQSAYRAVVRGKCDHCEWHALTTAYPEMVELYHDHLRDAHPGRWVRA